MLALTTQMAADLKTGAARYLAGSLKDTSYGAEYRAAQRRIALDLELIPTAAGNVAETERC